MYINLDLQWYKHIFYSLSFWGSQVYTPFNVYQQTTNTVNPLLRGHIWDKEKVVC
jgi:hypothetical protein